MKPIKIMKYRKVLLVCGILSSLLYVGTDILAAMKWEAYSYTSQGISELMAIGAPTRPLLVALFTIYDVLIVAFAFGILVTDSPKRSLRFTGIVLIVYGILGQVGLVFFPMHVRGSVGTITDPMHAALTAVIVLLILLSVGFGANVNGKWFRFYSIGTILILFLFGAWASMDGPRIAANLPTPWMGVKERINVYGYMLWVMVLAILALRMEAGKTT